MSTQNKQSLSQRTLDLLRALFANKLPDEQESELWNVSPEPHTRGENTPAEFDDEDESEWSGYAK
ncbi:MAG TPA: hypothetical protein VIX58_02235 [Anaerolineae bacterium]